MHHLDGSCDLVFQVVVIFEDLVGYAQGVQVAGKMKPGRSVKKAVSFVHHASIMRDNQQHRDSEPLADYKQVVRRNVDTAALHIYGRGSSAERSAGSNRNPLRLISNRDEHQ